MNPSDYIAGLGALLTGVGLIYAGLQVRLSRKIARAQFLLQLDTMFREHKHIENKLRGEWATSGPKTAEEWIGVEDYMGLFERVQTMIDDGIIDLRTFDLMYGYKVFYLVRNKEIYEHKLVERADQWVLFNRLLKNLEALNRNRQIYPVTSQTAS